MPLAPEVKNWLDDIMSTATGVPDEQKAVVRSFFEQEEVGKKAKQSVHAASDYNRHMDEVRAEQQRIQAREAEVERWVKDLGVWKAGVEKEATTYAEKAAIADEYEKRLKLADAELKKLREEGYTNFNLDLPAKPSVAHPSANGSGSITQRDMEAFITKREADYAMLMGLSNDIVREHHKLFGEYLEMQPLITKALKLNKPLDEVWATEYKVSERRNQLQEEAINQRVKAAVDEQLAKERSNLVLAGSSFRANEVGSPVLDMARKSAATPTATAPVLATPVMSNSGAVADAVAAYQKGTFQVKLPGQT